MMRHPAPDAKPAGRRRRPGLRQWVAAAAFLLLAAYLWREHQAHLLALLPLALALACPLMHIFHGAHGRGGKHPPPPE